MLGGACTALLLLLIKLMAVRDSSGSHSLSADAEVVQASLFPQSVLFFICLLPSLVDAALAGHNLSRCCTAAHYALQH